MNVHNEMVADSANRRSFIGINLWRKKRDEIEPEDLSGNLIVQPSLEE